MALEVGGLVGEPTLESTGMALLLAELECVGLALMALKWVVCKNHFGREQILIFIFQKEPLILFFHKF